MLFLNDLRLEVRTACERKPTRDTPTANPNTNQANIWSTPVKSFLMWCNIMDIQTGAHCAQMYDDMSSGKSKTTTCHKCHS